MDAIAALGSERGIRLIEDAAQAQGARYRGRRCRRARRRRRLLLLSRQEPRRARRRRRRHDERRRAGRAGAHAAQLRLEGQVPPRRPGAQQPARLAAGRRAARQAAALRRVERAPPRRGRPLPASGSPASTGSWSCRSPSGPSPSGTCSSCAIRSATPCRQRLAEAGVDTIIHYPIPPHLTGAYAERRRRRQLPVAERLADEVLSLPMGPHLALEDAETRGSGRARRLPAPRRAPSHERARPRRPRRSRLLGPALRPHRRRARRRRARVVLRPQRGRRSSCRGAATHR